MEKQRCPYCGTELIYLWDKGKYVCPKCSDEKMRL